MISIDICNTFEWLCKVKRSIKAANDKERQKDRKTERQKDRKTERQKDRKTERQKDRKTERQKEREKKIKRARTKDTKLHEFPFMYFEAIRRVCRW